MRPHAFLVALLAASLGVTATARAQCPSGKWGDTVSLPNTFTTSVLDVDLFEPGTTNKTATLHVDQVTGVTTIDVEAFCPTLGDMRVQTTDVFQIVGPPSLAPILIRAVLHVTGNWAALDYFDPDDPYASHCYAARISGGISGATGDANASWGGSCDGGETSDVELAISHAPGEPFSLTFTVAGHADCAPGYPLGANISTELHFLDLPAGYGVTSCRGFATPGITPTRRATWASVKARYR